MIKSYQKKKKSLGKMLQWKIPPKIDLHLSTDKVAFIRVKVFDMCENETFDFPKFAVNCAKNFPTFK